VSQLAQDARVQFTGGQVSTPGVRSTARGLVYWIVIAIILVIFGLSAVALTGSSQSKARLSGTNPGVDGAAALIAVLRQDGVQVYTPRTLPAAESDAAVDPSHTTVVLYDQAAILRETQLKELSSTSRNLILLDPGHRSDETITPTIKQAGTSDSAVLSAKCDLPGAKRAGDVTGFRDLYRIAGTNEAGCFPENTYFGMVRVTSARQSITVVGATTTFTNESILQKGNAAFALGLFGQTKHLVWYLPSASDATGNADGMVPIPAWVTPAIVLAGAVLLAAAVWRGRRFGPVVVERMPVFVRASETLEGRARLYQKSSDRTHVLDALRIGAIRRMASMCGLSARASMDDVIGAVARATGADTPAIRAALVDEIPHTDMDLLRLSDQLADLESALAKAVRPR
jgi:hypothetical protein